MQLRRAARLRRLYPSARARRYKRVDDGDAKLKHFFKRKTYAETHAFAHIFSCSTNNAKNLVGTRVMNSQSRERGWEMSWNFAKFAKFEVWRGVPMSRASFVILLTLFAGVWGRVPGASTYAGKPAPHDTEKLQQKLQLFHRDKGFIELTSGHLLNVWEEGKRLACALARRFTLSQNGYGTQISVYVPTKERETMMIRYRKTWQHFT